MLRLRKTFLVSVNIKTFLSKRLAMTLVKGITHNKLNMVEKTLSRM